MLDKCLQNIARLPGIFVTGTDTGVGKTWVGTRLIHALKGRGLSIAPRKPVESGWAEDVAQTDAWQLAEAAGVSLDSVCSNRFKAPLSPPRAAQQEGMALSIERLARQCRASWIPEKQFLFVEGAGGFYSPLAQDGLNADLAQTLDLPLLLVSEDRVGCINHVLLIAEAAARRRLKLAGVILNPRHSAPSGMDNLADLQLLLSVPVLRFPSG